jgi:hypothetical protein
VDEESIDFWIVSGAYPVPLGSVGRGGELYNTSGGNHDAESASLVRAWQKRTSGDPEGPTVQSQRGALRSPLPAALAGAGAAGETAARACRADARAERRRRQTRQPKIPSAYTYFGQFVDHDLTFDPVSSLQRQNDPDALVDFRSPRFDLDSVYGSGPDDEPFLYQQPERLRLVIDQKNTKGEPDLQATRATTRTSS